MRAKLIAVIVIVLLMSTLVSNCAPTPAPPEPTTPPEATKAPEPTVELPPAPDYIELGASIPLTGKYGSLGTQVLAGYEYAIEDVNAAGGVYVEEYDATIPLRLTHYDDESDPTKAVSKMETLYSEQEVVVYLGGAASDMHAASAAIAEKNKVPISAWPSPCGRFTNRATSTSSRPSGSRPLWAQACSKPSTR
jgi:branched-chain amino acid transport system substrate-binding protein